MDKIHMICEISNLSHRIGKLEGLLDGWLELHRGVGDDGYESRMIAATEKALAPPTRAEALATLAALDGETM
jgi:hypothetical protein